MIATCRCRLACSRLSASFSFLFSGIVRLRLFLYSNRLFLRDKPLDCLVIVVGNLTVGGTGKTPVVERFAKELMEKGKKVAILSRGYKSKNDKTDSSGSSFLWRKVSRRPKVVSDGKEILLNSDEAGDEPFMLASNLPGAVVLAHKDRVNAGRFAIKKFGVNVIILDDGFQYLSLKGQLNLLLVDQTNPFGNRSLLPRGILREPIRHLSRASSSSLPNRKSSRISNFCRRFEDTIKIPRSFVACTSPNSFGKSMEMGFRGLIFFTSPL